MFVDGSPECLQHINLLVKKIVAYLQSAMPNLQSPRFTEELTGICCVSDTSVQAYAPA
jgi:hypothetical protein